MNKTVYFLGAGFQQAQEANTTQNEKNFILILR